MNAYLYLSIIYQKPVKYSREYPHLFIAWSPNLKLPLFSWFFIMAINFYYASGNILQSEGMHVV